VASIVRSQQEAVAGRGLADYCHKFLMETVTNRQAMCNMFYRLPTKVPFSMSYFGSERLHHRIQCDLRRWRYNFIMVHCSSVAQYVEHVSSVAKMLDFGDMDSQKWLTYGRVRKFPLNFVFESEGKRMEKAEKELARKFDMCTCTTKAERETLDRYETGARTGWFPNGVDIEYFHASERPYEPDTMCFLGRMDYFPNQEGMFAFCENVLPRIKGKRPKVRLFIIGANPSKAVKKLERISGVTVTGSVNDVRPYVHRCAVNVAPLNIARGTQNKVLESMAMGVPSVISDAAARGVDLVAGEHALVAGSHAEFADAVIRLLSDDEERRKFSRAGRARMLSHHNWEGSMLKLDRIIEDCLKAATL
jgi:sugar transferase (PEP-CTERM/EpsH1 system associated)